MSSIYEGGDELTPLRLQATEFAELGFLLRGITKKLLAEDPKAKSGNHPAVYWNQGDFPEGTTVESFDYWDWRSLAGLWVRVPDNWIVLDLDNDKAEAYWRARLGEEIWAKAAISRAPNGRGIHLWFRLEDGVDGANWAVDGKDDDEISFDVRGMRSGGIKAPPTPHHAGGFYEWLRPLSEVVPLAEAEAQPLRKHNLKSGEEIKVANYRGEGEYAEATRNTAYGLKALSGELAALRSATEGRNRNHQLNKSAFSLGQLVKSGHLKLDLVTKSLTEVAEEIGLDADEINGTTRSGMTSAKPRAKTSRGLLDFDRTDTGNAERLAHLFSDRLRYVPEWGWMAWDGRRWVRDPSGQGAKRCAKEMSEKLLADVGAHVSPDADERKKWTDWVTKSRSSMSVKSMVHLAEADPAFLRKTSDFDRYPALLTVDNGTADLQTGQLLPHDPKHQITKMTKIDYVPNAECPQFMDWLAWFVAGDTDRMGYLQRLAGLALIGDNREQISPYFLGEAETGKSTLCDILYKVIGEYAATASPDMLAAKGANTNGHRDELASLAGARMLIIGEIPRGWALNTSLYNEIVGADQDLRVSFKGKSTFQYRPQFTLFIHGNHTPVIKDSSNGVSRRMKIIKCYAVRQGEKDARLASRLVETEGPGILAWAIRGAVAELAGERLVHPQDVEGASQEVKETNNDVQHFVEECLVFGEGLKLGNSTLWALYEQWRDGGGGQIVQPNEGAARLAVEVLGYAASRDHKVVRSPHAFKDKYANGKNQRGLTGVGPVAGLLPTPSVSSQNKK